MSWAAKLSSAFTLYDRETSLHLEQCYNRGDTKTTIRIDGRVYVVVLSQPMHQYPADELWVDGREVCRTNVRDMHKWYLEANDGQRICLTDDILASGVAMGRSTYQHLDSNMQKFISREQTVLRIGTNGNHLVCESSGLNATGVKTAHRSTWLALSRGQTTELKPGDEVAVVFNNAPLVSPLVLRRVSPLVLRRENTVDLCYDDDDGVSLAASGRAERDLSERSSPGKQKREGRATSEPMSSAKAARVIDLCGDDDDDDDNSVGLAASGLAGMGLSKRSSSSEQLREDRGTSQRGISANAARVNVQQFLESVRHVSGGDRGQGAASGPSHRNVPLNYNSIPPNTVPQVALGSGDGYAPYMHKDFRIQRASLYINGTKYVDPEELPQELGRREICSRFNLLINPNKVVPDDLRNIAEEAWKGGVRSLKEGLWNGRCIKFGPKDGYHYGSDRADDVIKEVEIMPVVTEVGEKQGRLHAHPIVTVKHYSQIQLSRNGIVQAFKKGYNDALEMAINAHCPAYVSLRAARMRNTLRIEGDVHVHIDLMKNPDVLIRYAYKNNRSACPIR